MPATATAITHAAGQKGRRGTAGGPAHLQHRAALHVCFIAAKAIKYVVVCGRMAASRHSGSSHTACILHQMPGAGRSIQAATLAAASAGTIPQHLPAPAAADASTPPSWHSHTALTVPHVELRDAGQRSAHIRLAECVDVVGAVICHRLLLHFIRPGGLHLLRAASGKGGRREQGWQGEPARTKLLAGSRQQWVGANSLARLPHRPSAHWRTLALQSLNHHLTAPPAPPRP